MKIEKVSIIGLGALGTLFGHHLAKLLKIMWEEYDHFIFAEWDNE